jgi:hypothetical protein
LPSSFRGWLQCKHGAQKAIVHELLDRADDNRRRSGPTELALSDCSSWADFPEVLTPAGTFRTLVVVLRHPETLGPDGLALLETAQEYVNELHRAFARVHGYDAPLVVFDSTNLVIEPDEVIHPGSPVEVADAVRAHGVSTSDYDFVIVINIDPAVLEGGFANPGGFIYVGNFLQKSEPLDASDWQSVAEAAYVHEVAHHWAWPSTHDWASSCGDVELGFEPFVVPPILFGWEDIDGDGVAEILDDTPYGRPPG